MLPLPQGWAAEVQSSSKSYQLGDPKFYRCPFKTELRFDIGPY